MSILSDAMSGKITFSEAVSEATGWVQHMVAQDPTATAAAGAILSDIKQAASDAISIGEGALGAIITPAALSIEATLDATLSAATHGLSVPFNPIINAGIDTIANALKAEIDAWSAKTKAGLVSPA